jgi:hypothetical protein
MICLIYVPCGLMVVIGALFMIALWPLNGIHWPQRMLLYSLGLIIATYLLNNYPSN